MHWVHGDILQLELIYNMNLNQGMGSACMGRMGMSRPHGVHEGVLLACLGASR